MAYCTASDVEQAAGGEKRLRELADYDRNAIADSDTITAAIAAADSWIDGQLAKRLAVSLAVVPELIKNISMDEAVYVLKRWRSMATENDRDDHRERLEQLVSIKKGESTVGEDPQPAASTQVVDAQTDRLSSKAVSRETFKGFA